MDKIHQSCDIHFESLMVNEFHGREFECGQYIPSGPGFENLPLKIKFVQQLDLLLEHSCPRYRIYKIGLSILFFTKWRNFGITVAFAVFFLGVYIALTEFNKGAMQRGNCFVS